MKNSFKFLSSSKTIFTFSSMALVLFLNSCSKSSSDTATPTTTTVAFEHATIKPLFDTYCASCHASGKSNAKDWTYNAADYTT